MHSKHLKKANKISPSHETISILEQDLKELKLKVKAAGKLQGEQRRKAVIKLEKT